MYEQAITQRDRILAHWTPDYIEETAASLMWAAEGDHSVSEVVRDDYISAMNGLVKEFFRSADPYFVSHEIAQALLAAAKSFPDTVTPQHEMFPSRAGFVWFEKMVPVGQRMMIDNREAVDMYLQGFFWVVGKTSMEGVFTAAFIEITHDKYNTWEPGSLWTYTVGEQSNILYPADDSSLVAQKLSWTFIHFIHQTILQTTKETPNRGLRRSYEIQNKKWPLVNVVRLRKVKSPSKPTDGEPVDWSCRWIVEGHWRNQAYGPGRTERRTVFIEAYVKGPEDKPLKPPTPKIFAVVR